MIGSQEGDTLACALWFVFTRFSTGRTERQGLWGGEGSLALAVRRLDRGLDEGLLAEMAVRRCQQTVVEPL